MPDFNIHVVPDSEVIRFIRQEPGRYVSFLGAGASAEAEVPTAGGICNQILDLLKSADPARDETELRNDLRWNDARRRYSTCLLKYGNDAQRVEYFRKLLRGKRPAFAHYATALLMRHGVLKGTCVTTNFDKLIEVAFAHQDDECQPIRMKEETQFWRAGDAERFYTVKLHGDYDTNNILNTRDETLRIEPELQTLMDTLLTDAGMVVLGAGGFEESIVSLLNELMTPLGTPTNMGRLRAPLGLYWGIYLGAARPERLTDADTKNLVIQAIKNGSVSDEIVEMMQRADTKRRPCAFFPVWGAGSFLFRLVQASSDRRLIGSAELYLDHEMRLRNVFTKAGLAIDAIDRHLEQLRQQRRRMDTKTSRPAPETVCLAKRSDTEIKVVYGDITSRTLMSAEGGRRAVLSSEDTCVSAGGGVAYSLMVKAGPQMILNELSKLAPVPIAQGEVAVTSGGDLPVHYIFHAAALKIEKDASYSVTPDDVSSTIVSAVRCALTLGVQTIFVPLLGAGVGPLTPRQSFEAIVRALLLQGGDGGRFTMVIVIFKESQLPRAEITASLQQMLPADYVLQSSDAPV